MHVFDHFKVIRPKFRLNLVYSAAKKKENKTVVDRVADNASPFFP